jgi:hypothetical protein
MKRTDNQDFGTQYSGVNTSGHAKRSILAIETQTKVETSKISSKTSKISPNTIKEKVRTHQGVCIVCGNRISEERISKDYNEPFCRDVCEDHFHRCNNIPKKWGMKFTHHIASVSLKLCTSHHKPSLWQNVFFYDKEEGLPNNFIPLKRRRGA